MNEEVQRFVDAVPEDRRPLFDSLRLLIERLYPEAALTLWYGVPTFKSKSGWVSLSYWKDGVSLHTNGRHNIAEFKAAYPRVKTGTGTINLKLTDDVPEEALEWVIRRAMEGQGRR
jgi:hypothetical protein